MLPMALAQDPNKPVTILCLGAHSDDIEIGCGATILTLLKRFTDTTVQWVVFSGSKARANEARASARRFLRNAAHSEVSIHNYRDGFFPYDGGAIKERFEELKQAVRPQLIFTHYRHDLHQDHRLLSELTRNTWRDHLILEYEIPKYDADLAQPNFFVPISRVLGQRKIDILLESFRTQAGKQWFDAETFWALMRLRGLECNAPTRYAEAFHAAKLALDAPAHGIPD